MKRILTLVSALIVADTAMAQLYEFTGTNNVANGFIPDNNSSGIVSTMAVVGLAAAIKNVTLSLDITGGYNGDLYAYLAGPNGGFAVLLNRVGVGGTSAYGYSDMGFNITFNDGAANSGDIHTYRNDSPVYSGGQLTGTWGSDGENMDPKSAPGLFTGSGSATLATFDNRDGNGTWTLFLADLSAGSQGTLVSWNLDITTVPEPSVCALGALGAAVLIAFQRTRRKY